MFKAFVCLTLRGKYADITDKFSRMMSCTRITSNDRFSEQFLLLFLFSKIFIVAVIGFGTVFNVLFSRYFRRLAVWPIVIFLSWDFAFETAR